MTRIDSKVVGPVLTVAGQCHLSGISGPFLQALQDKLTIDNPKYKDAKKYGRWVGKNFKQQLHFFELDETGIFFPRGLKLIFGFQEKLFSEKNCLHLSNSAGFNF